MLHLPVVALTANCLNNNMLSARRGTARHFVNRNLVKLCNHTPFPWHISAQHDEKSHFKSFAAVG